MDDIRPRLSATGAIELELDKSARRRAEMEWACNTTRSSGAASAPPDIVLTISIAILHRRTDFLLANDNPSLLPL